PVRRESKSVNPGGMTAEGGAFLAAGDVPEPDELVRTGGGKGCAVGRIRHREDFGLVSFQQSHEFFQRVRSSAIHGPKHDITLHTACGGTSAIRRQDDLSDSATGPVEGRSFFTLTLGSACCRMPCWPL